MTLEKSPEGVWDAKRRGKLHQQMMDAFVTEHSKYKDWRCERCCEWTPELQELIDPKIGGRYCNYCAMVVLRNDFIATHPKVDAMTRSEFLELVRTSERAAAMLLGLKKGDGEKSTREVLPI
jgi:hypothetical protein